MVLGVAPARVETISLVFSVAGSLALAWMAIRSPAEIRRQVSPTWNELGDEASRNAAGRGQKWATFGFVVLFVGLLGQAVHHYWTTPPARAELLETAVVVGPVLALAYLGGVFVERKVREELG